MQKFYEFRKTVLLSDVWHCEKRTNYLYRHSISHILGGNAVAPLRKKEDVSMRKPQLINLPRVQKELAQCQMCGYCIDVCEAHRQTPWESVTARGKIYYLNQLDKTGFGALDTLLRRKVTLSPEFVDAMYKCTGCGNCEEVCHAKIKLVDLWEKIRKWMADEGVAPLPVHKKLEKSIIKNGNPYNEPKAKRDAWWPEEVPRTTPPQAIFFAGCTGSYRMQNIPRAAVTILDRAGVTVNCLGENEVCCTSPLLRTGINMQTLEASKEVVTKADALGAKDMVMSCSGCYKTVSSNYVEYYGKPGQNVYHITQYVDKLIANRKLPLNNEFKAKVTYHDPCHLGRHSKVFEEPRNILKKIKGIEFVEMERNRENSRCCGAGGGYKSAFNDFAVNIAAERIRDAEAVGAEVIATACPFCVLNLKQGAAKIKSKVKVMDITEILLQVTGPVIEKPAEEAPAGETVSSEALKEAEAAKLAAEEALKAAQAEAEAAKAEAAEAKAAAAAAEEALKAAQAAKPAAQAAEPAAAKPADPYEYAENVNGKNVANGVYDQKRADVFSSQIADVKASDMPADAKDIAMSQIIGGMILAAMAAADSKKAEEAPAEEPAAADEEAFEEAGDDFDIDEDEWAMTPEGIVRRAAWNKGLRCRRNYGPLAIPVAFVRWKVAVYVDADESTERDRESLEKEGWVVVNYKSSQITDGQEQAEELRDTVKSQMRALKKKKKKKKA